MNTEDKSSDNTRSDTPDKSGEKESSKNSSAIRPNPDVKFPKFVPFRKSQ